MDRFSDKKATLLVLAFLCLGLVAFFCFAMLFTAAGYNTFSFSDAVNSPASAKEKPVIVIDAGHGGEDPGAVIGNVREKDINLAVSAYLGELFESCGYKTVYTRTEDKMLYEAGQENRKKHFDLYNRVAIASEYDNCILLSIHVNRFSSPKYSGLQVFFSDNDPQSGILAKHIQNRIRALQPQNNRLSKNSGSSIYLLNKFDGIGVLIECGFISNDVEREKLCNDEYLRQLSLNIFVAVSEYINGEIK